MDVSPRAIQAILRTEAQLLEDYLLHDEVYRQIQIAELGNRMHLMSLGDFLEHRALGDVLGLPARFPGADADTETWEQLLRIYRRQAERLGARELKSRLDSLQWNMEDWSKGSALNRQHFAAAMSQRIRMQRIADALGWLGLETQQAAIDRRIRHLTVSGPFLGEPAHQAAYPETAYWFLYRNVK